LVTTYNHYGTFLKLGSKFLHPRLKMYRSASNTLHSRGSKENKGVLLDKIRRMQNFGNEGFQVERTISDTREIRHLQDYPQNASIMMHFLDLLFLNPKSFFYAPF